MYLGDVRSPTRLTSRDAISRESGKSPPKVVLAGIPAGNAGAVATLKIMRQFVRAAVRNPDQIVRAKALSLVGFLPARDWIGQIKSCFEFVRDSIRYVKDPVDVELVQTPESSLDIGQGDCDDKATLLAALLMTIGHPCRFVALGFRGEGFSHVLVETRVRDGWMSLETILPVPMGWYPSGVTRRYVLKV